MSTAVRKQEGVGKESTALAALSRALVNSFIFFFKRPIRLFRPVKSTFSPSHGRLSDY